MKENCLLIKTNNEFLTPEKNLPSLIEFAKTFNAEIYLVEPHQGQKLLELKALTAAICDPQYSAKPQFTKVKLIFPMPNKSRTNIVSDANKIRNYVIKRLESGKTVSLKELKKKYENKNLTDACLCNHLSGARKYLEDKGCEFEKISAGTYRLAAAHSSSNLS